MHLARNVTSISDIVRRIQLYSGPLEITAHATIDWLSLHLLPIRRRQLPARLCAARPSRSGLMFLQVSPTGIHGIRRQAMDYKYIYLAHHGNCLAPRSLGPLLYICACTYTRNITLTDGLQQKRANLAPNGRGKSGL
jgi:hypothetical protein